MDPLILLVEPELDERAATATMTRAKRVYEEGARDISRVMRQQMTEGTTAAGKGFDDLETKARRAYLSMQDASEKVAAAERKAEAAREKGSANAESLARKAERARLDEIQAIERATAAYKEYGRAAENAGQSGKEASQGFLGGLRGAAAGVRSAGGEMAGGFVEGFAGSSALMRLAPALSNPIMAAVVAVGAIGGKVLADNIAAGLGQLQIQDAFQARMGVNDATMARFGESAAKSYVNMFGASIEDNLRAVQFGVQGGVINPGSSDAEVQKTIANMQTLSQVMGVDVQEAARASGQLIRGGFAKDGTEAADIIATGFQNGLDIAGDWLDTVTEYTTQFRKLGLDGADAIGLISQGLQGAARDSDVVADSLKEFSIRAVDGSKSTAEGFAAIGFKADDMAQKILAGGDSARAAFGATLEAIKSLQDPQQQALVWADLFGTQWEDMGNAVNKFDLSKARNEFSNTDGAIDEMTNKLSTHTNGWDSLGRQIDTTFGKLQKWLADTSIGKFFNQSLPAALGEKFDALAGQFDGPKLGPNGEYTGVPSTSGRPLFPQGPGITTLAPPTAPSGNPLDIITGGVTGGAGTAPNFYKDWYKPPGAPAGAPTPGAPTPILTETQQAAKDEAEKAAKASLPPTPVLPLQYTNTAGMPAAIANATSRLDDARHEVAEKEARVQQLEQSNIATAEDNQKARNDLAKAQQDQLQAEQALNDARINATKQANKQLGNLSAEMDDFGNKLDSDFGISKGLGGIVENFVKAAGNILAAPFLQALGLIAKANPNEGSGLIGIAAANGAFGSQYTPGAIAAAQGGTTGFSAAQLPGMGQPYGLAPGTNTGGYGSSGAVFPGWVHALEQQFGVKASTYPGHQESDRNEPGYAPNPGHENRGIDWSGSVENMQRFADYLSTIPGSLEQVIFQNPNTGQDTTIAGGRPVSGYYDSGTLSEHENHVHTRQSQAIPLPGGFGAAGYTQASGAVPVTVVSAPGMPSQGLSPDQWNAIAGAEASGNWSANTGNGFSGGLQFAPSTWTGFGGGQYAPEAWQATPQQQMAIGDRVLAAQGPGAWPATSAAHPEWFQPQPYSSGWGPGPLAPPSPGTVPTGGGTMAPGMPQGLGIYGGGPGIGGAAAASSPTMGGGLAYPSQGGNSGNAIGGLPLDAAMGAASALDAMMPGAGAAAKIGIQLANRTIGYAAQNAGIAASGLLETFSVGDNPKGSLGAGWLGKVIGGLAGAAPALPNIAGGGGKKPPGPMQQPGGKGQPGNVDNSQTNNITLQPPKDTSANTQAAMVAEQTRMYAPAGRQ